MNTRSKLIGGIALAAIGLGTWSFMSPPSEVQRTATAIPSSASPVKVPEPVPPDAATQFQEEDRPQSNSAATQPAELLSEPNALTEQNLIGTKWAREGFMIPEQTIHLTDAPPLLRAHPDRVLVPAEMRVVVMHHRS